VPRKNLCPALLRAHEPAILQHSAGLHKGRQRHLERSGKFAHRGRTARQPFENSPAGRIAQSVETWVRHLPKPAEPEPNRSIQARPVWEPCPHPRRIIPPGGVIAYRSRTAAIFTLRLRTGASRPAGLEVCGCHDHETVGRNRPRGRAHSPPTPIPRIRRMITKRTAPQMPMRPAG